MATEGLVTEGKAPFNVPNINDQCETYYKIFGDLHNGNPPIVVVHGGPGSGYNYLLAFSKLLERYGLPVIFYDQIGTGHSTHLRHKLYDTTFWTIELLVQQLESLITYLRLDDNLNPGYHILGHSVGGMIGSFFATRRPRALKKLVLANSPGSVDLHCYGMELCWKDLGGATQQAFEEALRTRDFKAQNYLDALSRLNKINWCRADPYPEELLQSARNAGDDSTVRETMWGQSPCDVVGSLKGWNCFSELPKINTPTLLYHGEWDIERDEVVAPYVEHIPGLRKVKIERASHMSHLDNKDSQESVLKLVGSFLVEG